MDHKNDMKGSRALVRGGVRGRVVSAWCRKVSNAKGEMNAQGKAEMSRGKPHESPIGGRRT